MSSVASRDLLTMGLQKKSRALDNLPDTMKLGKAL